MSQYFACFFAQQSAPGLAIWTPVDWISPGFYEKEAPQYMAQILNFSTAKIDIGHRLT